MENISYSNYFEQIVSIYQDILKPFLEKWKIYESQKNRILSFSITYSSNPQKNEIGSSSSVVEYFSFITIPNYAKEMIDRFGITSLFENIRELTKENYKRKITIDKINLYKSNIINNISDIIKYYNYLFSQYKNSSNDLYEHRLDEFTKITISMRVLLKNVEDILKPFINFPEKKLVNTIGISGISFAEIPTYVIMTNSLEDNGNDPKYLNE